MNDTTATRQFVIEQAATSFIADKEDTVHRREYTGDMDLPGGDGPVTARTAQLRDEVAYTREMLREWREELWLIHHQQRHYGVALARREATARRQVAHFEHQLMVADAELALLEEDPADER